MTSLGSWTWKSPRHLVRSSFELLMAMASTLRAMASDHTAKQLTIAPVPLGGSVQFISTRKGALLLVVRPGAPSSFLLLVVRHLFLIASCYY